MRLRSRTVCCCRTCLMVRMLCPTATRSPSIIPSRRTRIGPIHHGAPWRAKRSSRACGHPHRGQPFLPQLGRSPLCKQCLKLLRAGRPYSLLSNFKSELCSHRRAHIAATPFSSHVTTDAGRSPTFSVSLCLHRGPRIAATLSCFMPTSDCVGLPPSRKRLLSVSGAIAGGLTVGDD